MRILVLGKSGFVSRKFQQYMLENHPDTTVDAISLRDEAIENLNFKNYDIVFNTIGLAHNNARMGTEEQFMYLNTELPPKLGEIARRDGVKTYIHMSSSIIYGSNRSLVDSYVIDKDTPISPEGIYGRSKFLGEAKVMDLQTSDFHVAVIRSPLVYDETVGDNFGLLVKYARFMPIVPDINNSQSMIYSENLCELVYLIAESNQEGIYFPQQDEYFCTSQFVSDMAKTLGRKIWVTKIFNGALRMLSGKVGIVDKAFGNMCYAREISDHFEGKYVRVTYAESIKRVAKTILKNKGRK